METNLEVQTPEKVSEDAANEVTTTKDGKKLSAFQRYKKNIKKNPKNQVTKILDKIVQEKKYTSE